MPRERIGPGALAGAAEAGVGWCDNHLDTTLDVRALRPCPATAMKKPKVGGPPAGEGFCWYTREMLLAPAFCEASINCRRFINALEFENLNHAGTENGNLLMPYNQLARWWRIPRRLIRKAINEAVERGLVEENRGLRLWYAKSMPTRFRLTFRPTREGSPPKWVPATNEWRRYRSPKNALNGSEVAPDKCHKVYRVRHPSMPDREPTKVPDRAPLYISRAEGGGPEGGDEGRGTR